MPVNMPDPLSKLFYEYLLSYSEEEESRPFTIEQKTTSVLLMCMLFNKEKVPLVKSWGQLDDGTIIAQEHLSQCAINFLKSIKEFPQAEIDTWDYEVRKNMYHFKGYLQEQGFDLGIDLQSPEWLAQWAALETIALNPAESSVASPSQG